MKEFKNQLSFLELPELLPKQEITKTTACFTGHRNISNTVLPEIKRILYTEIEKLYFSGIRCFLSGGAIGFDTLAAKAVLKLRQCHTDVSLFLVFPCLNQEKFFNETQKKEYHRILSLANGVRQTQNTYYPGCMQARNRYLINNSDLCVAYYTGVSSGGTAYTVRYAERRNKAVINLANQI